MEGCSQEGGQRKNQGVEIELIKMKKFSDAAVFFLQSLSACGEEGLTTIIRWWKVGSLINL